MARTFPDFAISNSNRRIGFLLRLNKTLAVVCSILIGFALYASGAPAATADQSQIPPPPADSQKAKKTSAPADSQKAKKNEKTPKIEKDPKNPTAEQVVESAIFIYGSRPILTQIRRNGVERGRIIRSTPEGKTEESTYERRFVRGESSEKDKIRIDQKMPSMEYSLIFGEGRLWGLINGAAFTPRQDAVNAFLSQHRHSIDALLRYKENGTTPNLVGREKQKGLDLYVLDLVDKEKQKTRYYLSVKSLHVLWLEYEEAPSPGATPLKYSRRFFDYRYAQSTLVPYRSVLLEDGKETQETRIFTVTYGVKFDNSVFQNPEA